MKRVYGVKISLVVDDEHRQAIIDQARRCYTQAGGASTVDDDGRNWYIPAEEAIQSIDDALMEFMQTHPAFDGESIEVIEMSCDAEEGAPGVNEPPDDALEEAAFTQDFSGAGTTTAAEAESDTDDLDEYVADVYLCRWPNGDFSVVGASSKREAIIELDEWAGAHPSQVHPLDSFKADFGLTDEGEIVLHQLGEAASNAIWDMCYPELNEVLISEDGCSKPGGRERIAEAVKYERARLWENQPKDTPRTELGKRIAERMGTSATVADYYADEAAKRILESDAGEDGKPN